MLTLQVLVDFLSARRPLRVNFRRNDSTNFTGSASRPCSNIRENTAENQQECLSQARYCAEGVQMDCLLSASDES